MRDYMARYRAINKGKPKRKRPVGRPRLPQSKYALDPKPFEPFAMWLVQRYIRQRLAAQRQTDMAWEDIQYRLRDALEARALEELRAICRRAPKVRDAKAYVAKALKVRLLGQGGGGVFNQVVIGNRWAMRRRRDQLRPRLLEIRRRAWGGDPQAVANYQRILAKWQETYEREDRGFLEDSGPVQASDRARDWAGYRALHPGRKTPKGPAAK